MERILWIHRCAVALLKFDLVVPAGVVGVSALGADVVLVAHRAALDVARDGRVVLGYLKPRVSRLTTDVRIILADVLHDLIGLLLHLDAGELAVDGRGLVDGTLSRRV